MRNFQRVVSLAILLFCPLFSFAKVNFIPSGMSLSYGGGKPDCLQGARVALQWDWCQHVLFGPIDVTGYWDASAAWWHSQGYYKSVTVGAAAPVFVIQPRRPFANTLQPYISGGIGLAALSRQYLGHRNLGARWSFQDLIGFGVKFGCRQQYNLSYHYLHYSNAGFCPPNHGIDVKYLVTFAYKFS